MNLNRYQGSNLKRKISIILWIIVFVLTLLIAYFQYITGPTHPISSTEHLNGEIVSYKLPRSSDNSSKNISISIRTKKKDTRALLSLRRLNSNDKWEEKEMKRDGYRLITEIPTQPCAGKIEYKIKVVYNNRELELNKDKSIVIRFKGKVPKIFLIIHVICMFFGIMFAIRTGMEVLRKDGNYARMITCTFVLVLFGGMVFGPIVQKYAFNNWWTGFPIGSDLTDNKMLLIVIFWTIAFFLKKKSKWWAFVATVLMLIVYLIPHSAHGSEFDYKTGKMKNKYGFFQISGPSNFINKTKS